MPANIIQNISNVDICSNELQVQYALNRNIQKLVENDKALYDYYKQALANLNVTDYLDGFEYNIGDFVWWRNPAENMKLYLLKCIKNRNVDQPRLYNSKFEKSGWKNEAEYLDILKQGVCCEIAKTVMAAYDGHERDYDRHPFGRLSDDPASPDYFDAKILRTDFSNIDKTRDVNLYPAEMKQVSQSGVVVSGYSRKYDSRVIEYNFVFSFSESEKSESTSDSCNCGQLGIECDCANRGGSSVSMTIDANTLELMPFAGVSKNDERYQTNTDYFLNIEEDGDIFAGVPEGNTGKSKIGQITFSGRNDYVNTYAVTLNFPNRFRNLNYMIYSNGVVCEVPDVGTSRLEPSANDLVFCDKTRRSVTVLYIQYPKPGNYQQAGANASGGGMSANSFHCRIVGECL